jgi:hypothetical protein
VLISASTQSAVIRVLCSRTRRHRWHHFSLYINMFATHTLFTGNGVCVDQCVNAGCSDTCSLLQNNGVTDGTIVCECTQTRRLVSGSTTQCEPDPLCTSDVVIGCSSANRGGCVAGSEQCGVCNNNYVDDVANVAGAGAGACVLGSTFCAAKQCAGGCSEKSGECSCTGGQLGEFAVFVCSVSFFGVCLFVCLFVCYQTLTYSSLTH